MTEGPRVNFVMREALFEIYTWILCLSYLHEKQTSRIQSLYTEQKKKGIILVVKPFSVLVESRYMGYKILLTAIFHIGLCHKFRDQSSVEGLNRQ